MGGRAGHVGGRLREWWNGRHARLRIWSRKGWRFKSSLAHHFNSIPRQKIDHEHVRNEGMSQGLEFLVFRVDEVGVAVLLILEGDEETMREALVKFLRADVGAPFQGNNLRDIGFKGAKSVFHLLDLFGRGRFLELERDDVADGPLFRRGAGGSGNENSRDGDEAESQSCH